MCERCAEGFGLEAPKQGRPRGRGAPPPPGSVPNDPFRERALELVAAGVTWAQLAADAGMMRTKNQANRPRPYRVGDDARLKRALGVAAYTATRHYREKTTRYRYRQRHVSPELAVRLARVRNLDPVEGGC